MRAELVVLTEEGLYVRPNDSAYVDFYADTRDWASGNTPTQTFKVTLADFAEFTRESMIEAISALRDRTTIPEMPSF